MADFEFRIGAHADLLNKAELVSALEPLRLALVRAGAPPTMRRVSNQGSTTGATTVLQIRCPANTVPAGFVWNVTAWRVVPQSAPSTQVAGICNVYRNEVQPSNWEDATNKGSASVANQIPNVGTSDRPWQWLLLPGESFLFDLSGLPNSTGIVALVEAEEYPWPPKLSLDSTAST